jgi:hypothetical protein
VRATLVSILTNDAMVVLKITVVKLAQHHAVVDTHYHLNFPVMGMKHQTFHVTRVERVVLVNT